MLCNDNQQVTLWFSELGGILSSWGSGDRGAADCAAFWGLLLEVAVNLSGSPKLTREDLDRFLARLDPDRQRAGELYQKLHHKLVKLFEWRGAPCPESLADETIDRVIHKLDQLEIRDLALYALGVARNIWKESQRASAKESPLEAAPPSALQVSFQEGERRRSEERDLSKRLECLEECVRALSAGERRLVLEYYEKTKVDNIRQRQKMADKLGIAVGALRVQAHRIRAKLAACVERCLGRAD